VLFLTFLPLDIWDCEREAINKWLIGADIKIGDCVE